MLTSGGSLGRSILVVASLDDVASSNIALRLLEKYPFRLSGERFQGNPVYSYVLGGVEVCLVLARGELVYFQEIPASKIALAIFVSRHESRSGVPLLSVHVPGNFSEAEFGGLPGKLSIAPANAMCAALRELSQQRLRLGLERFEVYYEGTHHGPSLDVPAMFLEIGSTREDWADVRAGEAAAYAVMAAVQGKSSLEAAVGIGGSHCNRRLTRLGLEGKVALGHIVPSYAFKWLTPQLIQLCVERTLEKNPTIVLDWKGIDGKDRGKLCRILESVAYPVRRVAEYNVAG